MLATAWPEPFSDPGWVFELKWDGVRTLLYWDGDEVELRSRRGRDVTATYPELSAIGASRPFVLDGEIVALSDQDKPSFELLQGRMNLDDLTRIAEAMGSNPVGYVAFDVLFDGEEVTGEPWEERRRRLESMAFAAPCIVGQIVEGDGEALWQFVKQRRLEGIVAKRRGSQYRPGTRSRDWRKVARAQTVRAIVGGYTPGTGGRSDTFGSLLLGLWWEDGLRWVGSAGTGFDDRALRAIRDALDEMTVDRCPFLPDPELPEEASWVQPQLVALVEVKEWTSVGRLRHPRFKGFTKDPLGEVTWEAEGPG